MTFYNFMGVIVKISLKKRLFSYFRPFSKEMGRVQKQSSFSHLKLLKKMTDLNFL